MSAARDVKLVAEREIRQRLRGKSFYVSTGLVVLVVLLVGVINRATGGDGQATATVGVTGEPATGLDDALATGGMLVGVEIDNVAYHTSEAARAALADGDVDAVIDTDRAVVLYADEEDSTLHAALQQAWATTSIRGALADAGLSPAAVDAALAPEILSRETLEVDDGDDGLAFLVGMFAGILLFTALQMYGGYILMGVVEEKSTAVIEVLLARLRATDLLAGKVLGIGAVAVLQFLILVVAVVVSLVISGIEVPGDVWAALPWTLVWFVVGFAMYGFLYALAGAMVSRQEDAQSAAVPVNVVLGAAYVSVFVLVGDPGGTATRVVSLIPPFTPLLMPIRIAAGETPLIDIAVALLLAGTTVFFLARASGSIYTKLVLRRGGRVRWLDALRAAH